MKVLLLVVLSFMVSSEGMAQAMQGHTTTTAGGKVKKSNDIRW